MGTAGPDASHDARVAELLAAYRGADYRWELGGEWHALGVGVPTPRLEAAFPGARRFGLLSAWNPQSVMLPDAANRAADELLRAALLGSGLEIRPAFSAAGNRSWREPSWLVMDMALPPFDALTHRFGQLATLAWQRGEPVGLRMHARRPAGVLPDASVEWRGPPDAGGCDAG